MNPKVDAWLDAREGAIVKAVQEIIAIPSVKAEPAPGAPFGADIKAALDHALALAAGLGFAVKDLDGYAGYAEFGEGEELVGILCHLDVVPAGVGWTYPPFGGELHDGRIYGRGTVDDKGPAVAALYAMAAVKECGLPMKRRVRLILGCDEESGMQCLEHYCKHAEIPAMSFSPDAEYPLVNSEKHGFGADYRMPYASSITIQAGERANVVPGEATATVPLPLARILPILEAYLEKSEYGCSAEAVDEASSKITVRGLSAHASLPEQGRNAFFALVDLLDRLPLSEADAKAVAGIARAFGFECHGESFGLDKTDASGRLTLNVGVIDWDETGIRRLSIDIRAPITMERGEIETALNARLNPVGLTAARTSFSKGYCMPPESELVSKLLAVYSARTGAPAAPLAIGGGTYARHLPNAVAFGCEIPGHEAAIHMPNEYITVEDLMFNVRVLADAVAALGCKEA